MRILVTGGSGYVGSWLVRRLLARGDEVVNYDLLPSPDRGLRRIDVRGDVRDREKLAQACEGVEVAVHLAARVPLTKASREFRDVNVGGTRTLLEIARRMRLRKVLHISSSAVFGVPREVPITATTQRCPVDPYGRSKMEAEDVCEAYRREGLNVVMLRPRTIVGPERLGIFQILFDWIARDKRIYLIGPGTNRLQLVSIDDFCSACVLAIDRANSVQLGIGGRSFGTLREDLGSLIAHAGSRSRIVSLPEAPAILALRVLDTLRLSPLAPWHYLTFSADFFYDETATQVLGYHPREGNVEILTKAYEWYRRDGRRVRSDRASPHRTVPRQGLLQLLRWLP